MRGGRANAGIQLLLPMATRAFGRSSGHRARQQMQRAATATSASKTARETDSPASTAHQIVSQQEFPGLALAHEHLQPSPYLSLEANMNNVEELSPRWRYGVAATFLFGLSFLILLTFKAYQNAPPIPARAVDTSGTTAFTGDEIRSGQEVFLKYGLMDNGTIWGHGGYLGPDFGRGRARHRRQHVGRMGGAAAMAAPQLVLVRQSGLGIPGDRTVLADSARRRPVVLVLPGLASRGARASRSGTQRLRKLLLHRGLRDSAIS